MGICAAGHFRHKIRLRPGGGGAVRDFLAGPFTGPGRGGTRERGHPPASETRGTGPNVPDDVGS